MTQTEPDVVHKLLSDCNGKTQMQIYLNLISKISPKYLWLIFEVVKQMRYMFNCVLKRDYEITIFSETFLIPSKIFCSGCLSFSLCNVQSSGLADTQFFVADLPFFCSRYAGFFSLFHPNRFPQVVTPSHVQYTSMKNYKTAKSGKSTTKNQI